MSAAERSPPCAEQSPAMRARIASPLLLAYMRSSRVSSSMAPAAGASESAGSAVCRSGSIQVRYAFSTTPGFSASAPCPSNTIPVTVKYRSWSYISTTRPPGWPLRERSAPSGFAPRKIRCRPSPDGETSV